MLAQVKRIIKKVPVLGPALQRVVGIIRGRPAFVTSAQYWDDRYRVGGTSGAGSYNRLAQFKAEIINGFVQENNIKSVIEFGCGDGAQLGLANYPRYTGIDVSTKAVEICRKKYHDDRTKNFFTVDDIPDDAMAELGLSLDVVYHLVEDAVFESYMNTLLERAQHHAIIYASNFDKEWPATHVKHRKFTDWVTQKRPDWVLENHIKNRYPYAANDEANTSFADFYIFSRKQ